MRHTPGQFLVADMLTKILPKKQLREMAGVRPAGGVDWNMGLHQGLLVRRSVAHGQISVAPARRITTQIEKCTHADARGSSTMKGAVKC